MRRFCRPNRYAHAGLPEDVAEYRIRDRETGEESNSFMKLQRAQKKCREANKHKNSADRFEVVSRQRVDVECYHAPSLDQLLEDADTSAWWDPTATWTTGFKDVPLWIWDKRLMDPDNPERPLGDIPRLVASYYVAKGLMDKGEVDPMQDKVARDCGISPKSVYLANQKLAKLGGGTVFRVVPRGGKRRADGSYEAAKSTMILYLPLRQITHEDAERERARFAAALAAQDLHGWDVIAYKAFEKLLSSWEGTERQFKTFYKQLQQELLAAGLPAGVVVRLAPDQPTT
jgi:hypothetical protein